MKSKFLFAAAALALTFGALVPSTAKADHYDGGYYVTRLVGYDYCGRPIYRQFWVPVCNPRPYCPPPSYCPPSGGGIYWSGGGGGGGHGHHHHHHHRR